MQILKSPQFTILETIFGQVNGASFVNIDVVTVPTMNKLINKDRSKPNPHYGRVLKHGIGHNVMVFQNKHTNAYENMVERRLIQEGKDPTSFELGPRQWGERIPNTPFIVHNERLYLEVIFLNPGTSFYSLDGVRTDVNAIIGIRESGDGGEQGGLENKVVIRTFAFDSIKKVNIGGTHYTIGD